MQCTVAPGLAAGRPRPPPQSPPPPPAPCLDRAEKTGEPGEPGSGNILEHYGTFWNSEEHLGHFYV